MAEGESVGVDPAEDARAERRAHRQIMTALDRFWSALYKKILRDEYERTRLPRLKAELESIATDEDSARVRRIEEFIERAKKLPPQYMPIFRAMDELLYGPIDGTVHKGARANSLRYKMATLQKDETGVKRTVEQISKELRDAFGKFDRRGGPEVLDRRSKTGQARAKVLLKKFFSGFERIIKEPTTFLERHWEMEKGFEKLDGSVIMERVRNFSPLVKEQFPTALQEFLKQWELDDAQTQKMHELAEQYPEAIAAEQVLSKWSLECEMLIDDVISDPRGKVEETPEPVELTPAEAEVAPTPQKVKETPKALSEPEKITDIVKRLKASKKRGASEVAAERFKDEILLLSDPGKRSIFDKLAIHVEYGDNWIKNLSGILGKTVSDDERRRMNNFSKARGLPQSENDAKMAWVEYVKVATRKSKFRNSP